MSHYARADSGVGSIVPRSETFTEIQNLWEAISSLTSTDGLAQVGNLIKHVSLQDDELKRREQETQNLNAEFLAKQKSYEAHQQEQLSQFEARYRQWDKKTGALQSEVKGLTELSEQNDKLMKGLRKEIAESKLRVEDLEKAFEDMTKRLKEKDQQLGEIDKRLDTTKDINQLL
ncbi:hypothetical protein K505DRAFT_340817 [Melanomma pulvis-pyrius CBS 109.77]|uniref:Uncharacterized protein n=1 Tax=Melanomma pulvis-pyrius CBS 109.77 TaxID=1314802 RepID=A0A6A6X1E4_9PLEO|nr:hypothetical protein K505DRAFT_340817 [Melanomma pulvis-pyrius CBS 109.77]